MSNSKISALTGATTPLAGTEVLPIVQSSTTKQVSVANLTAGRAISATSVTASTGNFVVGASGQGIDFSATPGTGTSELFADYEEGTFTATLTCGSGTITLNSGQDLMQYTKIGRMVYISGQIGVSSVSSPSGALNLAGLPFTINGSLGELAGRGAATILADSVAATVVNVVGSFLTGGTTMTISKYAAGIPVNMAGDVSASSSFFIAMQYVAA